MNHRLQTFRLGPSRHGLNMALRLGLLLMLGAPLLLAAAPVGGSREVEPLTWIENLFLVLQSIWEIAKTLFRLSDLLLSCWSGLLIFIWLVATKYKERRPDYPMLAMFLAGGVICSFFALFFNMELSTTTRFNFFEATSRFDSFMAFFIGAGIGEEFWKMSAGLIVVVLALGLGRNLGDAGRILGFVVVGLSFAVMENIISYAPRHGLFDMLQRGLLATPLHAIMGMIHGWAVNRSIRRQSPLPLLSGYALAVIFHTLYDTIFLLVDAGLEQLGAHEVWPDLMMHIPHALLVGPIVFFLLRWAHRYWRTVPEGDPSTAELDAAADWI